MVFSRPLKLRSLTLSSSSEYPLPSPVQMQNPCPGVSVIGLFSEATFYSYSLIWMEAGHINSLRRLGAGGFTQQELEIYHDCGGSPSPFGYLPRQISGDFRNLPKTFRSSERSIQVNCMFLDFLLGNCTELNLCFFIEELG